MTKSGATLDAVQVLVFFFHNRMYYAAKVLIIFEILIEIENILRF